MKNTAFVIFLWILIFHNVSGQEPVNVKYENLSGQQYEKSEYKQNRFTVYLFPSFYFSAGKLKTFTVNPFLGMGAEFDYNFSEIISLGLRMLYTSLHVKAIGTSDEAKFFAMDFTPVFKVHLGKNRMIVPFLETSYTCRVGKQHYNYIEEYTPKFVQHIISGGIGVKIYASRWFKKTKYKNNFGIECSISKAFFVFDNTTINDNSSGRGNEFLSIFYKF